jgi:hypothetical protein
MIGNLFVTFLVVGLAYQHIRMAEKINHRITRGPTWPWLVDALVALAASVIIIFKIWRP